MFCPNKVMSKATCFIHGELNDFFRPRGQSEFTENDPLSTSNDSDNGVTYAIDFDPQVAEHLRSDALSFAYQSQKQMFRAYAGVLEMLCLFLCQRQHVTCSFGKQVRTTKQLCGSGVFSLDDFAEQL